MQSSAWLHWAAGPFTGFTLLVPYISSQHLSENMFVVYSGEMPEQSDSSEDHSCFLLVQGLQSG